MFADTGAVMENVILEGTSASHGMLLETGKGLAR